jgi:hypothetical protein
MSIPNFSLSGEVAIGELSDIVGAAYVWLQALQVIFRGVLFCSMGADWLGH